MARAARWAAAVAILATVVPAAPGGASGPRRSGVLTGDTTVTWTGVRGIRLATRGRGSLPEKNMTLVVRGGTYAFVSMLVDPQPAGCAAATTAHCYGFLLAKFPLAGEFVLDTRPGYDHVTNAPRSPSITGTHLDLYLMTDGEATLRLRPQEYAGRSSYVAGGRIRGTAVPLGAACANVCGSTPVTDVAAGGAAFDLGSRPGQVVTHAYSRARQTTVTGVPRNHPYTVRSCYYPNAEQPDASAAPADHSQGCDPVPRDGGDVVRAADADLTSLRVGTGTYESWNVPDQTGRRYVGFWAGQAWAEEAVDAGYGVWFNYGIT